MDLCIKDWLGLYNDIQISIQKCYDGLHIITLSGRSLRIDHFVFLARVQSWSRKSPSNISYNN